ncbi:hypothetical protein Tco_0453562, partial [Tanacetum coccineum]
SEQKDVHDIFSRSRSLSLQHNFGKTRVKSTACYSINYPRDDQVPHSEGNSNSGDLVNNNRRMQTSRRRKLDGSRDSAIHTKYRILLRSSSMREPRYPLPRVVCDYKEATSHEHTANGAT